MNIWIHSQLSAHKFGGKPEDYYHIHKFIDSSKLFLFHVKHRLLLHNTYGVELCIGLFGDTLTNKDGKTLLTRDVAAEHLKEDHAGHVPTLSDWLKDNEDLDQIFEGQKFDYSDLNEELKEFLLRPYLQTGKKGSLVITHSDFGIQLVQQFFGTDQAKLVREIIPQDFQIKNLLSSFRFTQRWQYSPDMKQVELLNSGKNGSLQTH